MSLDWNSVANEVCAWFVMAAMATSVDLATFWKHVKTPKGLIIGMLSQFIFMPAFCYLLTKMIDLNPFAAVGLILIGCCPGFETKNKHKKRK